MNAVLCPTLSTAVSRCAALLCLVTLATLGACRPSAKEGAPSAASATRQAPAPGFRRVEIDGWSLDVPPGFRPAAPTATPEASVTFVFHWVAPDAPGAPDVRFTRLEKPANYPSRAYGLAALDRLEKLEQKEVVASRQHAVGGLEVTDIEVRTGAAATDRHQWRRMFVHEHRAYALIYSVNEGEAARHRGPAAAVLRSLTVTRQ